MNYRSAADLLLYAVSPSSASEPWKPLIRAVESIRRREFTHAQECLSQLAAGQPGLLGFAVSVSWLRVALGRGDIVEGVRWAEAIRSNPIASEPLFGAIADLRIGILHRLRSDFDLALHMVLSARSYFSEIGWTHAKALCDAEVANVMLVRGDVSAASAAFMKLKDAFQEEPLLPFRSSILANMAAAMQRADRLDEARGIYTEVLQLAPFNAANADRGTILQNLALNHKLSGRYREAESIFNEALTCLTVQEAPSQYVRIHNSLADLAMRREDRGAAAVHFEAIANVAPDSLVPLVHVEVLSTRAWSLANSGNYDQAVETVLEALTLATSKGLIDESHSLLNDALQWASQSGHRRLLLEEYRRVQDVRVKKAAESMNAIVELRTQLEQERARREVERQQELSRVIVETQTRTMNEISRELHDSLGQDMTVLQKLAERMLDGQMISDEQEWSRMASTVHEVAQRAARDTRRIAHLMSGSGISAEGLADAISMLRSEMAHAMPSLDIDVSISGSFADMTFDKVRAVYRIIQTSMQNVARHSEASSCCINLIAHEDHYHLSVEDNGIGFDPVTIKQGIGLREIKARVELVGGQVRIESMPSRGTYIEVTIPREQGAV
ncbi:MAG: tetratricopeptide repeat protein [Candidatus Kapabacteria bacterium]|nr:tetratricopeptide repeat protein [Candidatus Kapabacteria bacterium]